MTLTLRPALSTDEDLMTKIMTASFNYDTQFYFGEGVLDGPPGYADGTLARDILWKGNLTTLMIEQHHVAIGLVSLDLSTRELSYFCLVPQQIGQGIGSRTWQLIESRYGSGDWQLETPAYSIRNHRFYEKLGFRKISEKEYPNGALSYYYKK